MADGQASASAHGDPTISTHVLDTGRGRPAAGLKVTLFKLELDGRPIRVSESLTDDDGRVRDLLGRPLRRGVYRLRFDVARRAARLLQDDGGRLRDHRRDTQLPRTAAARAVLDEHVPGQLSGAIRGRGLESTLRRAFSGVGAAVRGRAAVPRPPRRGASVRLAGGDVLGRPGPSPSRCRRPSRSSSSTLIRASGPRRRRCRLSRSASRATTASRTRRHAAEDRRRRGRARPAQRRLRGPVRVPLLRLRRRSLARGAPARDGRRPRRRPRDASWRAPSTRSIDIAERSPRPHGRRMHPMIELGRQPLRQVRHPARQGRPRRGAPRRPRPDHRDRPRRRLRGGPYGRRQQRRRRHGHDEEHGVRVRQATTSTASIEAFGRALAEHFVEIPASRARPVDASASTTGSRSPRRPGGRPAAFARDRSSRGSRSCR